MFNDENVFIIDFKLLLIIMFVVFSHHYYFQFFFCLIIALHYLKLIIAQNPQLCYIIPSMFKHYVLSKYYKYCISKAALNTELKHIHPTDVFVQIEFFALFSNNVALGHKCWQKE